MRIMVACVRADPLVRGGGGHKVFVSILARCRSKAVPCQLLWFMFSTKVLLVCSDLMSIGWVVFGRTGHRMFGSLVCDVLSCLT